MSSPRAPPTGAAPLGGLLETMIVPKRTLDKCDDVVASSPLAQGVSLDALRRGVSIRLQAGRVPTKFRVAMADGATESSWSGLWAHLLVEAFLNGRIDPYHPDSLSSSAGELKDTWWRETERLLDPRRPTARTKRDEGSAATFLGVEVDLEHGEWCAVAVGDTCLLWAERGTGAPVLRSWPVQKPEEFSSTPHLILTSGLPSSEPVACAGKIGDGQRLWLATDAMAKFMLEWPGLFLEAADLWRIALGLEAFLPTLREGSLLRTDDLTLSSLRVAQDLSLFDRTLEAYHRVPLGALAEVPARAPGAPPVTPFATDRPKAAKVVLETAQVEARLAQVESAHRWAKEALEHLHHRRVREAALAVERGQRALRGVAKTTATEDIVADTRELLIAIRETRERLPTPRRPPPTDAPPASGRREVPRATANAS